MGGPLRIYTVHINGHETLMQLNDSDAERLGGVPVDGPSPEPLAAPVEPTESTVVSKARRPANKSRVAQKAAE